MVKMFIPKWIIRIQNLFKNMDINKKNILQTNKKKYIEKYKNDFQIL